MDGQEVQPTRISKDEYLAFKQWVQDVHGTTRGHLSTEIENALREYREDDGAPERLARIEEDVSQLKALVADAEGDGGTDVQDAQAHTHAGPRQRPSPNAARKSKVAYLAGEVQREYGVSEESGEIVADDIRDVVVSAYAGLVIEYFDAVEHPQHGKSLVWGERLAEARDEKREQASAEMEEITNE
jgi:hypothetical protein